MTLQEPGARKRGQPIHRWSRATAWRPKPGTVARTPLTLALEALFPIPHAGILAESEKLLLGRASRPQIRRWRRGQAKTPQWALEIVCEALHAKRAEYDHALALAEAELTKRKGAD